MTRANPGAPFPGGRFELRRGLGSGVITGTGAGAVVLPVPSSASVLSHEQALAL
jgi:hypothetical protein